MSQVSAAQFFKDLESTDDFHIEDAKIEFALELKRAMDREKLSRASLAERLNVSRPMVSKLLRGDANVTIETMVKAARRVKGKLFISIVREDCSARLFQIARTEMTRSPEVHKAAVSKSSWNRTWEYASNDLDFGGNADEAKPVAA